jgi:hypothetical protein
VRPHRPGRRPLLVALTVAVGLLSTSAAVAQPATDPGSTPPLLRQAPAADTAELGPARPGPAGVRVRTREAAAPDLCDPILPGPRAGTRALRDLGDRLPEVAERNGRDPGELRELLREDATVHVDRCGALFYVDPPRDEAHDGHVHEAAAAHRAEVGPTVAAADLPAPLAQTFELQSRPGSQRTIYLDFDGHTATGTGWNVGRADPIVAPPFSLDANPAFSDAERNLIQRVWQQVAEDFAPFDVNVTTKDLGAAAIDRSAPGDQVFGTRAVITELDPAAARFCGGCAGVAYLGNFDIAGPQHAFYQPAWIFSAGIQRDAQMLADTISHEVGHNLELEHQGDTTYGEYSFGQGLWAPIMGSGLYPLSTWSGSDYLGATKGQDDVVTIAARGAPLVADDHGNGAATATVLGTAASVQGVVERRDDQDWFRFTADGPTTIAARPAPSGPNLDLELQVRTGDGTTIVATDDPLSSWPYFNAGRFVTLGVPVTGLDAAVRRDLAPGTYVARVRGVGAGDPLVDGYSDYGSLGRYTLEVAPDGVTPPPPAQPPVVTVTSTPPALTRQATVSFSFTATPSAGTTFECRVDGGPWQACTSPRSVTVAAQGRHTFDVRGTRDGVISTPVTRTWTFDSVAPVITTTGTPTQGATVSSTTADLDWTANEPLSTPFSCRLTVAGNVGAWQPDCGVGVLINGLPSGSHRIELRATDLAGNQGAASRSWTVSGGTTTPPPSAPTFSDVAAGSTHARAISVLAQRGVTLGCGGTRFCPDAPVTRDQMATFLGRALELQPGSSSPPFTDVPAGSTHARYIDAVRREGITLGCGDGRRYCPRDLVARDQMASFLTRALKYAPGSPNPPFRDVTPGSTHARSIDALRRENVTTGCSTPGSYCPGASVTRAQMATFLVRALGW